jgi:serine/threonine protein phosphatase PrpC
MSGRNLMQKRAGVDVVGLTDIGCARANNEDSYAYWEPADDDTFFKKGRLALIADGMGGHEGGQEASRIAVETIEKAYAGTTDPDIRSALVTAFQEAHQQILLRARQDPSLQGMGTTCTGIVIAGGALHFAHIGDSRLYLLRGAEFHRLTRDHSYVGRLVETGMIGAAEAATHPHRNVLLQALGSGGTVSPDSPEQPLQVEKGDTFLLCTDGLWGMVSDNELKDAMFAANLETACRGLIALAKQRGGPDNITLQALRISSTS